jgi:hypothetical protein
MDINGEADVSSAASGDGTKSQSEPESYTGKECRGCGRDAAKVVRRGVSGRKELCDKCGQLWDRLDDKSPDGYYAFIRERRQRCIACRIPFKDVQKASDDMCLPCATSWKSVSKMYSGVSGDVFCEAVCKGSVRDVFLMVYSSALFMTTVPITSVRTSYHPTVCEAWSGRVVCDR